PQRRHPLLLLELRLQPRLGGGRRRRGHHDLFLWQLRRGLGHVVQHTVRLRRGRPSRRPAGRRQLQPGLVGDRARQDAHQRPGIRAPGPLPGRAVRAQPLAQRAVERGARELRERRGRLVGGAVSDGLRGDGAPFSWGPLRVQELEERVRSTREATICALNQMLDLKDLNTGVHSTRLAEWAVRIGREMGMEESGLEDIEVAALLHDAGKVGVPDAILRKPGPLDPEEWRVMRMHPEFSWAVLRLIPGLERASLYALHHHEKFDGSGYPSRLKGEEIPIGARIVAVIDAFDAMVASRPYKEGLPIEEALRRLALDSGRHFDPAVVRHFVPIASAEMQSVFEATGVSRTTEL